jgi:hypothetical protein
MKTTEEELKGVLYEQTPKQVNRGEYYNEEQWEAYQKKLRDFQKKIDVGRWMIKIILFRSKQRYAKSFEKILKDTMTTNKTYFDRFENPFYLSEAF